MINLEHFGPNRYLPARPENHCIPIALALHELTGWPLRCFLAYEVDFGAQVVAAHAVVESPKGFFDAQGPNALKRWWSELRAHDHRGFLSLVDVAVRGVTVDVLRDCYVERSASSEFDERRHASVAELRRALPLAHAVLKRHRCDVLPLNDVRAS